jgi:hypothetical protein
VTGNARIRLSAEHLNIRRQTPARHAIAGTLQSNERAKAEIFVTAELQISKQTSLKTLGHQPGWEV